MFFLFYNFIGFIILLYTFFVTSSSQYREYMTDVFHLVSAISDLWSICLGINIFIPLPFCCLLRSRTLIKDIVCFVCSFIFWNFFSNNSLFKINQVIINIIYWLLIFVLLALIKSFAKNDRLWYSKKLQNSPSFIFFLSAIISFKNSSCNFNLDFFYLGCSVVSSGIGALVGILSNFFTGNICFFKVKVS